jgi:type II secretion system protein H
VKDKGFSLIEIIVVLAILGLSISLVTPSLSQFLRTVELKGAAKKVGGILRYCRSEAVNKGRTVQVLFDSNSREVRIQSNGLAEGKEEQEKKEDPIPKKAYSLPDRIRIKKVDVISTQSLSDVPLIEFYPNGGSNGGSILLDSEGRNSYNIEVHFLTGMVKVVKGEGLRP